MERLSEYVFSDKYAAKITDEYNQYVRNNNNSYSIQRDAYITRLKNLDKDISRTVSLLLQTTSNALTDKLKELEIEKAQVQYSLNELEQNSQQKEFSKTEIKAVLSKIRELLSAGTLDTIKTLIDKFVSIIIVYPEDVIVHFNFFPNFTIKPDEQAEKDCLITECGSDIHEQSISTITNSMADEIGGAERPKYEPFFRPALWFCDGDGAVNIL